MAKRARVAGDGPSGNMLLHAALDSMSHAFSVWDEARNLVLFNQAYEDMYYGRRRGLRAGMSLREVCALSIANGNHPEDSAETLCARYRDRFDETAAPGARAAYEKRVHGRLIRSVHIRAEGAGWIVTHEDITEAERRAERERERERQAAMQNMRFATAVDHMSQGLCMFGPDRRLIICNKVFARMYGLPADMVTPGRPFEDILAYRIDKGLLPDGETAERHRRDRMTIVAEHGHEQQFFEREGGRLIHVIHRPMTDGGWVSTHQDITEQRQREDLIRERSGELEQQNMRFVAAVNNMSHGLSMFDADRRLVVCNQAYQKLYGLPDELCRPGTSFWDMLDHGAQSGMVSITDPVERRHLLEAEIAAGQTVHGPIAMANGKTIMARHQPLADGGWLATHEDITEQRRNQQMVERMARQDGLTGLCNRTAFLETMAAAEPLIAAGEMRAVLCIDLDRFKPINDNFGHAAGDAVLAMVGKRIGRAAGKSGSAARVGGDEFAILTGPVSGRAEALAIARRLIAEIERPYAWEGYELTLGASIGVVLAPEDGTDTDTLLRHGDLALYAVKDQARGHVCLYEPQMDSALQMRRAIEAGLKSALQNNEISLDFQPLMELSGKRVACCEALMRWTSRAHGTVPPGQFIPVAEETGLIRDLGNWALMQACLSASKWPAHVRVAVNVSPVQFKTGDLVEKVKTALARSGLPAARLELEITESLFLDDSQHTLDILYALKDLGVRIALDDFGTGYSSLSYLRSFPFDKIKIDRSFVAGLDTDADTIAIVRAVAELGKSLGMSTVAEGVETQAQLDSLVGLGCTEVQGYLISPPLPERGLTDLIGRGGRPAEDRRAS